VRVIKTLFFISLSHGSKVFAALIVIKLIAVNLGPEGMGFLGNYMSLISIATSVAGGGVITGAAKYVAGFKGSPYRQTIFIGNAIKFTSIFGLLVLLVGFLSAKNISEFIFGGREYYIYIYIFLVSQFLYGYVNLAFGVMNGLQNIFVYSVILISGSFLYIVLAYVSISYYGLAGGVFGLTAFLLSPILPLIIFMLKSKFSYAFSKKYTKEDFSGLFKFSIMLLVSAVSFPLVEMHVRGMIVDSLGLAAAGTWQGVIRLSAAYLSFISIFLSFYIVPRLSAECDNKVILRVLSTAALVVFSVMSTIFIVFNFSNEFIIHLVLSDSFGDVRPLLLTQMVGDSFRVMGWVVGFLVIAKAATKIYILGELLQGLMFVIMVYCLFDNTKGVDSIVSSYVLACFLYFLTALTGLCVYLKVNSGVK
jgi:O-antigen/teichoic acid export membrane protein